MMIPELVDSFKDVRQSLETTQVIRTGKLIRSVGLALECVGCCMPIGARCLVNTCAGKVEAEVVGFANEITYLMPRQSTQGILPGSAVEPLPDGQDIAIGEEMLGRVLDANAKPLDGMGSFTATLKSSAHSKPINPLLRKPVSEPLDVGVRAINAILTVGKGQRMGIEFGT